MGRSLIKVVLPVVLAVTTLTGSAPDAHAQLPPDAPWRTLETEHFRVTFPQHLEALARRAGARAEQAWANLEEAFVEPPGGRIDLVVTDHTDVSNGYAQVTPSNRITVHARPPVDDLALGFFDEWMELVVTHEVAHIFHLDRTGTLGRVARGVFGRVPDQWPFFPNRAVPRWTLEGLATWYESELTEAGRVHGTFHEMVMRTALLEGRFEGLDQASGESPVWPGGNRAYTYGSQFFEHLLDKHGPDRMGAFAEAVAGQWIPYRLDAAGRDAFGASLSQEWDTWVDELEEETELLRRRVEAEIGPVTEGERLTPGSRVAWYPALSPDGSTLAYGSADGRSDPQLRVSAPDGSGPRRLARTSTIPEFDFLPDGSAVFAHLDFDGPYRTFSDLEVVAPSGERRRVTRGARLTQPSAGPDGTWVVAVLEGEGTNALVRVELADGSVTELVPAQPDVHWALPAVSPDGRWIAVSRWTPGAYMDVFVLDAEGREVLQVTRDRALDLAPAWTPDGGTLVWTSDRSGIFNVVAASVRPGAGEVGPLLMATNVLTGAAYPSVDPAGRWLYYSGYHADGWEVERMPFTPSRWPRAPDVAERFRRDVTLPDVAVQGEVQGYSAFPTVLPKYWEPLYEEPIVTSPVEGEDLFIRSRELLGASVGAQSSGVDLVGRHAWSAYTRFYLDGGGKADFGGSYSFAGMGVPVLSLSYHQWWDDDGPRLGQLADSLPVDTLFVLQRSRDLSLSATFHRRSWRSSLAFSVAGGLSWEARDLLDNELGPSRHYQLRTPESKLSDFRVTLSYGTARSHAFPMGGARGYDLWLRGRTRRDLTVEDASVGSPGSDRSVDEVRGVFRGYLPLGGPGYAQHVLALRVAGGQAGGPNAHASYFDVGGAAGSSEAITGQGLFGGSPIFFPLRGYPAGSRSGRTAWVATAEYRFPLLIVNRGLGAWPLHLDRVSGSLFLDAGNAWGPELDVQGYFSPRRSTLASAGAEVTTDVLTFWNIASRVRVGAAVPLVEASGATVYVRLGLPF